MGTYTYPGVYIQEVDTGNKPIEGVSTSIAGFLGIAERGPMAATFLTSFAGARTLVGQLAISGHRWLARRRQRKDPVTPTPLGELEAVG